MNTKLGDFLREKRAAIGASLRDVERLCKVDRSNLSRIERGETREAMPSTLLALARLYRVSPEGLMRLAAGESYEG